jgi:CubicO group peptidase (beta-lactamase class C family)
MSTANINGFSRARLERIGHFLEDRYIATRRIPCAQLLIARGGELVYQTVLGWQDKERGVPLAENTVFRIYSMTKPVTSVLLMTLVEEGMVSLEDPVAKYILGWEKLGVFESGDLSGWLTRPPVRAMQILDLLRHTSGLTYGLQARTNVDAAYRFIELEKVHGGLNLTGLVGTLATLPLEFSPGEAWNYSVSTDVLGYVIQQVTGQSLDKVFQARIFDPLKMRDTGFWVREDQRARFAACYEASPDGGFALQDDPQTSPYLGHPTLLSGGAGLVSTASDYMRFCRMLLNGGELEGARVLAPRTVKLMTANHLPGGGDMTELSCSMFSESANAGIGFGLGFAVAFDPVRALLPSSPGEYYWAGVASTAFWIDPVEDIAVIFLSQLVPSSSTSVRRELRTMIYSALLEPNA